jgi:uncharacterized membrane protein YoaK (UPF0700 family)
MTDAVPAGARSIPLTAAALVVAVVLAAVAGFVDAVGFNQLFGVFPANQSGNVAFLGMAIGGDSPAEGWRCAVAIAGFAAGTAAAFALGRALTARRRGPTLLTIEIVLLVAVSVTADPAGDGLDGGFTGFVLVVLGSVSMGVQTEAIRRVAGVAIATTYQSGAVARVGEVTAALFGERRSVLPGVVSTLPVLGAVLVTYCGGAALGAAEPGRWDQPLLLPLAALMVLSVLWFALPRWFAAVEAPDPSGRD